MRRCNNRLTLFEWSHTLRILRIQNISAAIFISLFALFVLIQFFKPIETEDIWWHLATARWILDHVQLPHFDPFPFNNEKTIWTCDHEWLGSVLLFSIHKLGGEFGLKIFRSLFYLSVLGVFFRYSYKRLPLSLGAIISLILVCVFAERSPVKPDIFNLLFVQIVLIVLLSYLKNPNLRALIILPFIGILWSNIHVGAVVYGVPLIGIVFISYCVQGRKKQAQEIGLTLLAYLAILFVNPYGIEGFLYPIKVLFSSHFGFFKIANIVNETQPPAEIFLHPLKYLYYYVIFILGLVFICFARRRGVAHILLFIFSFFAFIYMSRNAAFFALVTAYLIADSAEGFDLKGLWNKYIGVRVVSVLITLSISGFMIFQIVRILGLKESYYENESHMLCLNESPYSGEVIRLLNENKIYGPVFNNELIGGKIIWSAYPNIRPFDDGRHVDRERFNNRMAVLTDPERNWPLASEHYNFKIVVLNSFLESDLKFIEYIKNDSSWQLISIEGPYIVYVRKGSFSLPSALNDFEQNLRSVQLLNSDLNTLEEKANLHDRSVNHARSIAFERFRRGVNLYRLGFDGAATKALIGAFEQESLDYLRPMTVSIINELRKRAL